MKSLLPSFLVGTLLTAAAPAQRGGVIAQDAPLPHLELPTIDGSRTVDLASLRGKKVLLLQFASW